MKKSAYSILNRIVLAVAFTLLLNTSIFAQNSSEGWNINVQPESINLKIDEQTQLNGTVYNAEGDATQDSVLFYSRNREAVTVSTQGLVKAMKPGNFEIVAMATGPDNERIYQTVDVNVEYPPLQSISFNDTPDKIYTGTTIPLEFIVTDQKDLTRDNVEVSFSSSDPAVAVVDDFGRLKAKQAGSFTITAQAEDVQASFQGSVVANPVTTIEMEHNAQNVRTGDVVTFTVTPQTESGQTVDDIPVQFSFNAKPDDDRGEGASGVIKDDGRFVANVPGLYTITVKAGSITQEQTIRVEPRNVQRELTMVGHALVSDVHTSDLWVWEGVDGRDYAITGTWGGNGEAYFWDVTDPENMQIIDTVTVDARTVNDVKISEDGRIGVITREGASDRKNGIVILDVTDPSNVSIISEYTQGLTGGVHNAFIYENHVFAVNNGRRYDIIDISDPKNPTTVSRFELDTPGHSIHDVWVENGIAYSSNWDDGIVAVDVGSTANANSPEQHNTGAGSLENPVKLGSYSYPSGWNHAAFPFKSQSTGDFYVIAGDEAFPNGLGIDNEPTIPAGYIHFVKFEGGWDNPKEVARYQIPEAGTHNYWVKGDTLYIAYYNAGLRVVDISGELMGNLYEQGREIAHYIPTHHEGRVPNAPMAWGPQPYKGYIFMSDWNSGLWAFELEEQPQGTN